MGQVRVMRTAGLKDWCQACDFAIRGFGEKDLNFPFQFIHSCKLHSIFGKGLCIQGSITMWVDGTVVSISIRLSAMFENRKIASLTPSFESL